MPEPWELKTNAIESKILDLEKLVSDLSKAFKEDPRSIGVAEDLKTAKDQITKLNLQLEAMKKPVGVAAQKDNQNGDDTEDFWPC